MMDTVQCLRCVLLACVLMYGESRSHEGDVSRRLKSANKRGTRAHDGSDNRVELAPTMAPRPASLFSSCCGNGGTCVMKTFCHCPKGFYGRRCEHRDRRRPCNVIPHGTWLRAKCNVCHCFDSRLTCSDSRIPNCGIIVYEKGREENPEYGVTIEEKTEDYDQFYDGYEDEHVSSDACSLSVHMMTVLSLPLVTVVWWRAMSIAVK